IGVFLPVLPTTPFLLLTVYFYGKGSIRFKKWFEQTRLYNNHLKTFVETKSMSRKQKWSLMIFVDAMLILSCFMVSSWILRLILILILLLKHLYFHTQVKIIPSKKIITDM
ncbi:MAG: DUF454 domain-containing protein, partial [Tenericutes bacterium HGW-Tenericutes-7]